MTRILVVEDESAIADAVLYALRAESWAVEHALLGREGLQRLRSGNFDLVVLDVGLPDLNGFDLCRELRTFSQVPVIFLTARDGEIDRVLGLELGADDYLTKPFSIPELQARVKAILRRIERQASAASAGGEAPERIVAGELEIDCASREVTLGGRPVPLTAKEFELLLHFARHPGRAFTRMQLLDAVWSTTFEGYEHNVNTHINRLRAKVEADPMAPRVILTVRGAGYKMRDA